MRDQKTLALAAGFETYSKTTRRSRFLEEMERVVPWLALCQEVEAYYPKAGKGRRPVGLERMLRITPVQNRLHGKACDRPLRPAQGILSHVARH